MGKCKFCGREKKEGENWLSSDYCGRSCAINRASEIKREYWDIANLVKKTN